MKRAIIIFLFAASASLGALVGVGHAESRTEGFPGVDPLQRPSTREGRLDYRVTFGYRPGGSRSAVATGAGVVEVVRLEHEYSLGGALTYYLTERLSLLAQIGVRDVHRSELIRLPNDTHVHTERDRRQSGVLGLGYRLSPEHALDPQIGVSVLRGGRTRLGVSVARIRDPIVTSGTLGVTVNSSNPGLDPSLSLGGSVGFVANDRVTVVVGVDHHLPVGLAQLPSTSGSVRWGWVRDPVAEQEIAVTVVTTYTGGDLGFSFGLEWSGRRMP